MNNEQKNDTLATDTTTPAQAVAAIKADPTSAKLVELQNAYKTGFAAMAALTDIGEQQAAMLSTFKIQNEIKTELANLKNAEREEAANMARNARIGLLTDLLAAHATKLKVDADKKSTDQERNDANDVFMAASDVVKNELLARYPTSKPAAKSADASDKPAGQRGATGAEIIAQHVANLADGKTPAESKAAIVAGGHSRGTTGAVVLAWEKEQGIK